MSLKFKESAELKPVLGAYAAMARNNAYLIVSDIMAQLSIEQPDLPDPQHSGAVLDKESHLGRLNLFSLENELKPEIKLKAMKLLCRHFPFLQVEGDLKKVEDPNHSKEIMVPITYEEKCKNLLDALTVLSYIRDENLHYKFNDKRVNLFEYRQAESRTGRLLRLVLKAAPRKVSDRFRDTGFVPKDSLSFFRNNQFVKEEEVFKFNIDWLFSPQRKPRSEELSVEKRVSNNGQDNRIILTNKDGTPQVFYRLSDFGVILLVSLFIEKRYHPVFLEQCGLFSENGFTETTDDGTFSQQRLLKEIISAYCVILPKRRLDIEMDTTRVSLDIINELARCPEELYSVLPESKRTALEINTSNGSTIVMKRHYDRFVPLVLRYIDVNNLFSRIRFQVNSGALKSLCHDFSTYMDGSSRQRIVHDAINSFGRIHEIEKARKATDTYLGFPLYHPTSDNPRMPIPCITDSNACYVINGDCIGMSIQGDRFPTIIHDNERYRVHAPHPDCWMSRYELPAMGFYLYLCEKYHLANDVEQIIIDKVNEYRHFFQGIADGTINTLNGVSIAEKDIPRKLLDFLKGNADRSDFQQYKKSVIDEQLTKTKCDLARFRKDKKIVGSDSNRIGKKSCVRIQAGKLASLLAKDIVYFQAYPAGKPEKRLTGQQYRILQGLLAAFHPDVEASCRRAGLLEGETSHPFLQAVFDTVRGKEGGILVFYETYLKKKLSYLKKEIPDDAPFLHSGKVKWMSKDASYYRSLARRYLTGGIEGVSAGIILPRGLFNEAISNALNDNCPGWKESIENVDSANTAFMIITYLLEELRNDFQWFYYEYDRFDEYPFSKLIVSHNKLKWGREYLDTILYEELEKNPGCYYKSLEERISRLEVIPEKKLKPKSITLNDLRVSLRSAYNQMCSNEKAIRRLMVQDIVLFLLARRQLDSSESMALHMIGRKDSKLMKQPITVTTLYRNRYRIQQKDIKIKDQGELFKILNDKRIDSLLDQSGFTGEDIIDFRDLAVELEQYDKTRVPVITKIQEYERTVLENSDTLLEKQGRIGFKTILKADTTSSQEKKEALRNVRNAYAHNTYPERIMKKEGKEDSVLYDGIVPGMSGSILNRTRKLVENSKQQK